MKDLADGFTFYKIHRTLSKEKDNGVTPVELKKEEEIITNKKQDMEKIMNIEEETKIKRNTRNREERIFKEKERIFKEKERIIKENERINNMLMIIDKREKVVDSKGKIESAGFKKVEIKALDIKENESRIPISVGKGKFISDERQSENCLNVKDLLYKMKHLQKDYMQQTIIFENIHKQLSTQKEKLKNRIKEYKQQINLFPRINEFRTSKLCNGCPQAEM
jgi:hypothetical protein